MKKKNENPLLGMIKPELRSQPVLTVQMAPKVIYAIFTKHEGIIRVTHQA